VPLIGTEGVDLLPSPGVQARGVTNLRRAGLVSGLPVDSAANN
jgi:hypothetical protein